VQVAPGDEVIGPVLAVIVVFHFQRGAVLLAAGVEMLVTRAKEEDRRKLKKRVTTGAVGGKGKDQNDSKMIVEGERPV